MTSFPVPLDNLIAYVKGLHPDGGPLENVSDAFTVSTQLDEQADALIGYFVDQARRSGLSWSLIGGAMGVSKQAAQKRFVPSASKVSDMMPESVKPFSQFTARCARTLAAAGALAAPSPMSSAHLAAALLAEPEGFAAKAIAVAVAAPERLYAALGTGPAEPAENTGAAELLDLSFDESAKDAVKSALKAALRLGHNYIGTEHLLLGLLSEGGPVAEAFTSLGLTPDRAERLIAEELAAYEAFKAHKPGWMMQDKARRPDPSKMLDSSIHPSVQNYPLSFASSSWMAGSGEAATRQHRGIRDAHAPGPRTAGACHFTGEKHPR